MLYIPLIILHAHRLHFLKIFSANDDNLKKTKQKKTPTFLAFRGNVNLALAIHRLAAVLPVFS